MAIEFYKIHTMDGVLTYVCKALFNMSFDKKVFLSVERGCGR